GSRLQNMTPDELQRLVLAGNVRPLVDALAPLDEAARRMLAKRAFELYQAANESERKSGLSKLLGDGSAGAYHNTALAVLACCDGSKARRLQIFLSDLDGTLDVLLARKPA